MVVYRVNKSGYLEELHTQGNYKPIGWYRTKQVARRYKNKG